MGVTNKFKKQKTVHGATSDGLDDEHILENMAALKSKEEALLNILADNQRRHNPALFRKGITQTEDQTALTDHAVSDTTADGAVETVDARVKNSTLPGLTKELHLLNSYDVKMISIISSSKIRNKVQQVTLVLTAGSTEAPLKPVVAVLTAREGVAAKLVTIAEIVKRNLDDTQIPWYQYSLVERKTVEITRETPAPSKRTRDSDSEDEDDEAFETMLPVIERKLMDKPKFRAKPVMTILLSRSPIKELKDAHG